MRVKQIVEQESVICDFCQESSFGDCTCHLCNKDICWDCSRKTMIATTYHAMVWFDSSRDILVCNACREKLDVSIIEKDHPLLFAYMNVERLRIEYKLHIADFKRRMEEVEQKVQKLSKGES